MGRSLAYLVALVETAGRYLAALFVMNKPTHRVQFALQACVIIVSGFAGFFVVYIIAMLMGAWYMQWAKDPSQHGGEVLLILIVMFGGYMIIMGYLLVALAIRRYKSLKKMWWTRVYCLVFIGLTIYTICTYMSENKLGVPKEWALIWIGIWALGLVGSLVLPEERQDRRSR
mgnify:CR=1 FL=1